MLWSAAKDGAPAASIATSPRATEPIALATIRDQYGFEAKGRILAQL